MEISHQDRTQYEGAPGRGLLSVLEIIVLGIASLFLVVFIIPAANDVETWCFLDESTAAADSYANAIIGIGLVSWLIMIVAAIAAFKRRRPTLGVLLPVGWFVGLNGLAAIITAAMGPQPCQGGWGW